MNAINDLKLATRELVEEIAYKVRGSTWRDVWAWLTYDSGIRLFVLVVVVPLLLLLGCASPRIAVLQNMETKQTVECRNNQAGSVTQQQLNNCIAAYEKAGYKLVADSDLIN